MRKILPYIFSLILILGLTVPTSFAHALGIPFFDLPDPEAILVGLLTNLFYGILTMMSWLLWLSGMLLNYVLKETVVEMSSNISGFTGINTAWKTIRDLMNILFIFLLVYEGIKLIIGQGSLNSAKKFILGVVMAALLINFSLFFTKILIDASNIVTVGFYNSILGSNSIDSYGLSEPIVDALKLTSLYKSDDASEALTSFSGGTGIGGVLIMGFGSGIIILVASFVLFAISILFIIRYVVLIILLMLSPIAFMGMALPFIKKYSDEWWNSLQGQLLFAPVYMIMTWVILTLMQDSTFLVDGSFTNVLNNAAKPPPSTMGLMLNYAIIIGLLIASLVIAKKTASQGSQHISTATGKLSAFAGGAVMGSAGRIGRNTVGRVGNIAANSEKLKDRAVNGGIVGRNFAKLSLKTGAKAANSTFDARGSNAFKTLEKQSGMSFGKAADPKKVNFVKSLEARAEKEEKFAKSLKPKDDVYDDAKAKDAIEKARLKAVMDDVEKNKSATEKTKNDAQKEVDDIENKIKAKEAELADAKLIETQKVIKDEIDLLKKESDAKKKGMEEIEKLAKEHKTAFDAAKKEHDEYKSKEEDTVKKIYSDRVTAYADRIQNEGNMALFAKGAAKLGAMTGLGAYAGYQSGVGMLTGAGIGGAAGVPLVNTRNDNRVVARKIRGVIKEQPKVTKKALEDLGIKLADETPEAKPEEAKPEGEKPDTPSEPKTT